MENRLTLVVVFVYTLGVLVTGLWVANPSWPDLDLLQIGLLGVVAVLWTVYFDRTIVDRIVDLETEDDEEDDATGGAVDAQSPAENEQAG